MSSDLVFINTNSPEDSKSNAKRKAVRSQAARDHSQPSTSSGDAPKRRRHKLVSIQLEVAIDESETSKNDSSPPGAGSTTLDDEDLSTSKIAQQQTQHYQSSANVDYSAMLPMSNMPGAGWAHPFVPYPEQKFVPGVLSHYLTEMAVDIPELDHPGAKGALRRIWFPMVVAEQATLNVVILTAAFHYLSVNQFQCSPEVLYKLKQDAISSINRGLQDPHLATSDQLIGAVAKMAAYEAGFAGDEAQYHMHMRGLVRMVELRGGLESLGLDGLLARMIRWIDLNSAFLLKTHLYFPHAKALPGHITPEPNPGHFLGVS
ncbi:MAG: hypothetical protein Q9166_005278 [cf. Caloplaca sp. 2 TL-2023]